MKIKYLLAASVVSLSTAGLMATPAAAQQITSGVEGQVKDENGNPLPGATVTVTDTRTGSTRTMTASGSGSFSAQGLVAGGPYTITATASGFEGQSVENQSLSVSGSLRLTFALAASTNEDVIVVTASRVSAAQLAVGPSQSFDLETLEGFPSITRNVSDIIRIDPRVSLDRNNEVDRISCLGGNDRSNTFTVDGIVQSDVFGLNGTPSASRNTFPIPFDAIRQTSVEFAPFDVEYSDFTGCAINVVTKSGENQFHGSAFYTFTNQDLRGDEAGPLASVVAPFSEKRWGATLSGPIIPDRLFFFVGYEETDLGNANEFGPAGAGFPNEADFVTQAQFDQFANIANTLYGQDVGGYPQNLPETSVRYFGRLDAYLTDNHRLEATYQRLEETNVESDTGTNNLTGLNSFEDEGTVSDYYSVRLYSDWTDRISTELRVSRAEVGDKQGPFGGGEAQDDTPIVRLVVGVQGPTENGLLSTGPGIFRSANQLDTKIDQARFVMNIDAGDHKIKLGAELNDLEVFNLFAINATGSIFFRNLTDFQNGVVADGSGSSVFASADDLIVGGRFGFNGGATIATSATGDINDASATFSRQIYSFFAQDEWQATDQLSLTAGVRVQLYDGVGVPRNNPLFQQRFGFSNSVPFSSLDTVILPRFSATYDLFNEGFFSNTTFTGGVGLFSGGDPVVFYSNAFSNVGFASANGDTFDGECAGLLDANGNFNVLNGGQFTGIPQCAVQAAINNATRGGADVKSTDPNFKVPTVLRANLGIDTTIGAQSGFFSNWNLKLDYIYSRFINPININDLVQIPNPSEGLNGFAIDGRPIIAAIDPLNPDCNAQLVGTGGTPPTYTGVTDDCFVNNVTGRSVGLDDFNQLTNGPSYDSHVFSIAFAKRFESGVFTDGGNVNLSLGYAFTDSNNTRNVFGATANGNFEDTAAFDFQDPAISTSNFETRHRFTVAANFREEFFDDYSTQLGMFFSAQSGRPYSLTFSGDGFQDSTSGDNNALLYIPTGISDPNLSPLSTATAADINSLQNVISGLNCSFTPGQTIRRNTCRNDWVFDMDLRLSQEIPGPGRLFGVEDRIELFADFDNFLNFIDPDWNVLRNREDEDGLVNLIGTSGVDANGLYILDSLNGGIPDNQETLRFSNSVWRIQVGVRYEF
ncbi:TonB-dependent receptor [Parasphingorhabdus sp.]|uniref:TonB-dependent receptor n=1 Tax=Parasphingorhabdus sp. TaxID=2709688 RepID=UPI003299AD27